VIIRINPLKHHLTGGTQYLMRGLDSAMELGVVPSDGLDIPAHLLGDTSQPATKTVKSGDWSPSLLQGDGRGFWASLGLRRHANQETGRFFIPFAWLFGYLRRYWIYWLIIFCFGVAIESGRSRHAGSMTLTHCLMGRII